MVVMLVPSSQNPYRKPQLWYPCYRAGVTFVEASHHVGLSFVGLLMFTKITDNHEGSTSTTEQNTAEQYCLRRYRLLLVKQKVTGFLLKRYRNTPYRHLLSALELWSCRTAFDRIRRDTGRRSHLNFHYTYLNDCYYYLDSRVPFRINSDLICPKPSDAVLRSSIPVGITQ
jgi:hypothetical protein